jgi:hypothetical protein
MSGKTGKAVCRATLAQSFFEHFLVREFFNSHSLITTVTRMTLSGGSELDGD